MQWTQFKTIEQLPEDQSFLVWLKEHKEWLEVSVKQSKVICHYFFEDVNIPYDCISHFCLPSSPNQL